MGEMLELALAWWEQVLHLELRQRVPLNPCVAETVELFCDARGSPAHVGAVLATDVGLEYTDWQPPWSVLNTFINPGDNQIMGLEILAVLVALCTWRDSLAGKCVRIWEDNAGAEGSLAKGASHSEDHNLLVHAIWYMAAKYGFGLWIERVASDDNISDCPSRERYETLIELGAYWVAPVTPPELWSPKCWAQY